MASNQPITLGQLIDALANRPQDHSVQFDFAYTRPSGLASYRGYYDHLALGWKDGGEELTVGQLLTELRAAIGKVYTGYKGGDFRMSRKTPLWVANYGEAGGTAVLGIADCRWMTVVATGYCDDWDGGTERGFQVLAGLGFGNAHLPIEADS